MNRDGASGTTPSGPVSRPPSPERRRRYRQGHAAERIAALFLVAKGYRVLARRAKTHLGEIDLIAVRGRRIAFVEVKARRSVATCEAAITPLLGARVRRAASLWLGRHPRYQQHEQGYDLVFVVPWRLPLHILNAL